MLSRSFILSGLPLAALLLLFAFGCNDGDLMNEGDDSEEPAVITLVPDNSSVGVGETITLRMQIDNATDVGSMALTFQFDNSVVQFDSAIEGTFLDNDGTNTLFLASESGVGGEVVVAASRVGNPSGASGQGLVAEFLFDATDVGLCDFRFTAANVKDPLTQNLPASFQSTQVSIVP